MNMRTQIIQLVAFVACSLLVNVGCQGTSQKLAAINPVNPFGETKSLVGVPDRVVGTWTEAVLHQSGKGTRGFGGRLYFYERSSAEPIAVEGQLVVYAFAEDARLESDNKPTKRYVFPPAQLAKHQSDSEIGVSYSVWLPWDAAGGEQSEVSLIARFEPLQGGGLVVSDQTRHRLPGRPRQGTLIADQSSGQQIKQTSGSRAVKEQATQASYQEEAKQPKPTMTATTISLPGRFKNLNPAPSSTPSPVEVSAVPTATQGESSYQPTPVGTTVKYLTPGESVRRSIRQRSFGSSP